MGDSIFGVVIPTIFGAIAAYMALDGNPVGCFIWIAMGVVITIIRWFLFKLGYTQGQSAVGTIAENMKPVTDARLHPGPRRRWRPRVLRRLHPRARHLHLR